MPCCVFSSSTDPVRSPRADFSDYKGGGDVESARAFMQEQFESKNRNPDKQIYTHVTCATDTHNIAAVFNAVKDIDIMTIIQLQKSLNEAGLISHNN